MLFKLNNCRIPTVLYNSFFPTVTVAESLQSRKVINSEFQNKIIVINNFLKSILINLMKEINLLTDAVCLCIYFQQTGVN